MNILLASRRAELFARCLELERRVARWGIPSRGFRLLAGEPAKEKADWRKRRSSVSRVARTDARGRKKKRKERIASVSTAINLSKQKVHQLQAAGGNGNTFLCGGARSASRVCCSRVSLVRNNCTQKCSLLFYNTEQFNVWPSHSFRESRSRLRGSSPESRLLAATSNVKSSPLS